MAGKRQYINLVGSSSAPAKSRKRKLKSVKTKSRRGGKVGYVKGRRAARSGR